MIGERVDAADFAQLYAQEAPRLWRAMFAFTGDRETANDVVAEAFAQCLRRGDEVRTPILWVWKAAFKIAAGELHNRRRVEVRAPQAFSEPEMPDLDLLAALAQLSSRQRVALILHYFADYSTTDVAAILGINAATVRVHLMNGRKRLRDILGDSDE